MFLRQTTIGRVPIAVSMSGLRLGERALQVGLNDPDLAAALAARTGITGLAAMVVPDRKAAERARKALDRSGVLVDVHVLTAGPLPFDNAGFDVVILHDRDGFLGSLGSLVRHSLLGECHRVLRAGGRVIVFERGAASGLRRLFAARRPAEEDSAILQQLGGAGFRGARTLADRDGYLFIEAVRA